MFDRLRGNKSCYLSRIFSVKGNLRIVHCTFVIATPLLSQAVPAALQVRASMVDPSTVPSSASFTIVIPLLICMRHDYISSILLKIQWKQTDHESTLALTLMFGLFAPKQVNVLTAQIPVVSVTSPSIDFASFALVVIVMRMAAKPRHVK